MQVSTSFNKRIGVFKGVVEAVSMVGEVLRQYDDAVSRMRENLDMMSTSDPNALSSIVYPNHLRDFAPVFEINTKKELEILANKYRLQHEQMTESLELLAQNNNKILKKSAT